VSEEEEEDAEDEGFNVSRVLVVNNPSASFCGEASANGSDAAPSGDCDCVGSGDSSSDGGGDGDGDGGARSANGVMHNGILSFLMLA
jgi:hypothetical protein